MLFEVCLNPMRPLRLFMVNGMLPAWLPFVNLTPVHEVREIPEVTKVFGLLTCFEKVFAVIDFNGVVHGY